LGSSSGLNMLGLAVVIKVLFDTPDRATGTKAFADITIKTINRVIEENLDMLDL